MEAGEYEQGRASFLPLTLAVTLALTLSLTLTLTLRSSSPR